MEEPVELTFQDLREITDDFSEKRIIGEGGFGIVYKGVTKHGVDVAVKKLRHGSDPDRDLKQFRNEFHNLRNVKHDNIIQFLGYCYERKSTLMECNGVIVPVEEIHGALCFEYMHNGSLEQHLSDESSGLDWHRRYKIIKGTCEGLRYIHEKKNLVHLDLKPDNILLDQDMVPKIADFGLSKIFGGELTRTTKSPLGTIGFLPPEFIDDGEISVKFDIFSLGVIIIKILSGREGYSKCKYMSSEEFIDQVKRNWRERWQTSSNDPLLVSEWCCQVETCTKIALLNCLEEDSKKRPDIVKIINMLNERETDNYEERQILQSPKERHKTVCETTRHNKMELIEEHKVITDVGEDLIVGRYEEENKIVASLLESIKSAKTVILPIYGIGGIGKTTFAKLIYNHTNFKHYSHVWVYVSPRFGLMEIGKSIDSQLSEENQANEQLISKEVLIVLDDLWEDNPIKIEELKDMLYAAGDCIKKLIVLVTTRSADIAQKICRNIEPYQIKFLTDEMCWDIIKEKSGFEAAHDKENENLVDIGKKIAQKCRGVALAAQTLGFMLRSIKHDDWITVKDYTWNETISMDTSLPQHVLASLRLSYLFSMDDLLKKCFTYCAIFPKGHKIVKYDLIYQWISLGFIMPRKILSALQICEKYIVRLLGLGFLQISTSAKTYQVYGEHDTVFTMHYLVHDLAVSLLGEIFFDQRKQHNIWGSNYCYALLTDCSKPLESWTSSPSGLSALRFLGCRTTELHGLAFKPAASLRVLDLSQCSIQKLPDYIGQLKQLSYLNAPRIRDQIVPKCITKLSNLKYLTLRGSCSILELPELIGEMEGLVHLDLSGCLGIKTLPESFGNLTNLEHVDFANCKNVTGVSKCLASLTRLQHLNLSNCKSIGGLPRALGSLTELQYLNLSNSSYLAGNKLAEAAEFPGSLTKFNYLLGSLTKLKYLNLSSSNTYVDLPSGNQLRIISSAEALGSLTQLKYLNLSHHCIMGNLLPSFGNLCNLVHLDLSYCYPLRGLPAALNGLTKLQYLDLYKCFGFDAKDRLQDTFGNLTDLRHLNLGCCFGKISHHSIKINGLLGWICTLTNLEYLSLRENNSIYSIPETIANLRKLHTLDLSSCGRLQRLPASISEIDSLKFLYTKECWMLDPSTLPSQFASSLRIPPHFVESNSYLFQYEDGNPARLNISRLENVKLAKEAQTIELVEKTDITQLALEWTRDAKRFLEDAEVLRELEPPYNVSGFNLSGYNSVIFPSWLMHIDAYLPYLTFVELRHLPSCNNLPPLGQLPNLENLHIGEMDSIKEIGTDLYGGPRAFPRLKEFEIHGMKWLGEWNMANSSDEDRLNETVFQCLSRVWIRDCPRLRFEPQPPRSMHNNLEVWICSSDDLMLSPWGNIGHTAGSTVTQLEVHSCSLPLHQWSLLHHLPCLQDLTIGNCSDLTCSSLDFLRGLTSLTQLTILESEEWRRQLIWPQMPTVKPCRRIVSLPEGLGGLATLTVLRIHDCESIKTLPGSIQQLTCLQTLIVKGCKSMVSLSEGLGGLASLEVLEIRGCESIEVLPDSIHQLTCLQTLIVEGCKSIMLLPEGLGGLATLTVLKIHDCESIKTLPGSIHQLTCLQTLTVKGCKSIVSLPEGLGGLASLNVLEIHDCESIKTLPVSIQQLTCLQRLILKGCESIVSLPERLGSLASLMVLEIYDCKSIKTLPDSIRQLTCLQQLILRGCKSIMSLPEGLGGLASLRVLEICGCESIEYLPDSIRQLTCLQTLIVKSCKSIVSLPERLGDVTSLTKLDIRNCKRIKTLPDTIGQLTHLRKLLIQGCPELFQWYVSDDMKHAHIKCTLLDRKWIYRKSESDESSDEDVESYPF